MAGCNDKHMARLLYAYEVGLLDKEERRKLEMHLLECEVCFQDLLKFRQAAKLIKHDPDVRAAIREDVEDTETAPDPLRYRRSSPTRKRLWATVIPVALATAALLILVFRPWQIEIRPTQEAVAAEKHLAIMYFDNLADEKDIHRVGEIATNLLITDLSESAYLQVVSGQRLYDILKLIGREGQKRVSRDIAQEVADTARAELMLLGSILQTEPYLELTAQLIKVSSGKVVASQRITGEANENIFSVIDKLTQEIRNDLALPVAAAEEPDRRVAEVTTESPEAYRHYLDGIEYLYKYYLPEAAESFARALEFDSTFAMAYYYLAGLTDQSLIDKAMEYLDHSSRRARYYIRSRKAAYQGDLPQAMIELQELLRKYPDEKEALHLLAQYSLSKKEFEQSVEYALRAVEIDPLDKAAQNLLAYGYDKSGQYENAVKAINAYILLAPDEPNPYDTRGEIYAMNGKLDLAIESFRKALDIKPDFSSSLGNLASMYIFKREYSPAESLFHELASVDDLNNRSTARLALSYIPVNQGKFDVALKILDESIAGDRAERPADTFLPGEGSKYFLKARILIEQGRFRQAIEAFKKNLDIIRSLFPNSGTYDQEYFIQVLAECGYSAEAEEAAQTLRKSLEKNKQALDPYWYAVGCIEFNQGNAETAAEYFEKMGEKATNFSTQFMLGRADLEADHLAKAAARFETILSQYTSSRAFWSIWSVKTHYYLGLTYEKSHWYDKALEQYERFLEIWQNADPGIPEVKDARMRLAKLRDTE